jgi:hypothetical protein
LLNSTHKIAPQNKKSTNFLQTTIELLMFCVILVIRQHGGPYEETEKKVQKRQQDYSCASSSAHIYQQNRGKIRA